jgi:TatD DNase family protein
LIIDTHCHLDDKKYFDDIQDVIKTAKNNGVNRFIIPGADPSTLSRAIELAELYDEIYFAVGVHPYDVDNFDIDYLKKHINHPKCVAVGECGLDYYRLPNDNELKEKNIQLQKDVFTAQITLAKEYSKPLIVHIRDASNDSKNILIEQQASKVGGVLHCFNASEHLLILKEHNFYFGIGGVVTFKNAKKLVDILPKIPSNKLLIETDSPYLTPHPYRGTRNEPKYTNEIASKIAQILSISKEELEDITTTNTKKLFGI